MRPSPPSSLLKIQPLGQGDLTSIRALAAIAPKDLCLPPSKACWGRAYAPQEIQDLERLYQWIQGPVMASIPAALLEAGKEHRAPQTHKRLSYIMQAQSPHPHIHVAITRVTGLTQSMGYTGGLVNYHGLLTERLATLTGIGKYYAQDLMRGLIECLHQGLTFSQAIIDQPETLMRAIKTEHPDFRAFAKTAGPSQVRELRLMWSELLAQG